MDTTAAEFKTGLSVFLHALWEAPGTRPTQDGLDLEELERNGWIAQHGDGWRITDDARVAIGLPKRVK